VLPAEFGGIMKLIIQIPCLNEEETIAQTIADLPRHIPGIDSIEIMVVDDGSTDRTAEVAIRAGAHHVVRLGSNRGLATAFRRGAEYALAHGGDILVNTDADNQYCGADIPKLVEPILRHEADLVVGCRPILDHPEFNPIKKLLQLTGSWTLRQISRTTTRDAASGFRAFSRETLQRVFIHSNFSYCMETLIQAGNSGIRVASVDIRVNPKTRDSRLFKSIPEYIQRSTGTMIAMFVLYRPGKFFFVFGLPFLLGALLLGMRFIYLIYLRDTPELGRTHMPSLILLAICAVVGTLLIALGILGEILKAQRRVTEECLCLQRKQSGVADLPRMLATDGGAPVHERDASQLLGASPESDTLKHSPREPVLQEGKHKHVE
jgi:glycosyltransferase involved in cell wall biosynthesis